MKKDKKSPHQKNSGAPREARRPSAVFAGIVLSIFHFFAFSFLTNLFASNAHAA